MDPQDTTSFTISMDWTDEHCHYDPDDLLELLPAKVAAFVQANHTDLDNLSNYGWGDIADELDRIAGFRHRTFGADLSEKAAAKFGKGARRLREALHSSERDCGCAADEFDQVIDDLDTLLCDRVGTGRFYVYVNRDTEPSFHFGDGEYSWDLMKSNTRWVFDDWNSMKFTFDEDLDSPGRGITAWVDHGTELIFVWLNETAAKACALFAERGYSAEANEYDPEAVAALDPALIEAFAKLCSFGVHLDDAAENNAQFWGSSKPSQLYDLTADQMRGTLALCGLLDTSDVLDSLTDVAELRPGSSLYELLPIAFGLTEPGGDRIAVVPARTDGQFSHPTMRHFAA